MARLNHDNLKRPIHAMNIPWLPKGTTHLLVNGPELKRLRMREGLTQPELADKVDLPQANISRAENERGETRLAGVVRLAEFFEVPLRSIIYISTGPSDPDAALDAIVIELISFCSKVNTEEQSEETNWRSLVDDCTGLPELELYAKLSENERNDVWDALVARRLIELDGNANYVYLSDTYRRFMEADLLLTSHLFELLGRLTGRLQMQYGIQQGSLQEAFDGMLDSLRKQNEGIVYELTRRMIALVKLPEDADNRTFSEHWCSANLALARNNPVASSILVQLHREQRTFLDLNAAHLSKNEYLNYRFFITLHVSDISRMLLCISQLPDANQALGQWFRDLELIYRQRDFLLLFRQQTRAQAESPQNHRRVTEVLQALNNPYFTPKYREFMMNCLGIRID